MEVGNAGAKSNRDQNVTLFVASYSCLLADIRLEVPGDGGSEPPLPCKRLVDNELYQWRWGESNPRLALWDKD
jgi:hypothetical protein